MAQSEGGHQDVCDLLLQYTLHGGAKVINPEQEVSEARQEEEVKKRESEGEANRKQQETNTKLTEVRGICVHGCLIIRKINMHSLPGRRILILAL
jgi:hypothetical protein